MAYIIGILSEQERAELKRRGWELEDAPEELTRGEDPSQFAMVFVGTNMFDIMCGPGLEPTPTETVDEEEFFLLGYARADGSVTDDCLCYDCAKKYRSLVDWESPDTMVYEYGGGAWTGQPVCDACGAEPYVNVE